MTPVSEPNGNNRPAEADGCDMENSPSNFAAAIALAATKGHGEEPIFF
jgi:hypothetical protein